MYGINPRRQHSALPAPREYLIMHIISWLAVPNFFCFKVVIYRLFASFSYIHVIVERYTEVAQNSYVHMEIPLANFKCLSPVVNYLFS
jgi:hypothetical protein